MSDKQKLVITVTANSNDDVSTVAFTVANAALSKGMDVGVFLTSDGVELCRAGGHEFTHVPPFKTLSELVESFVSNGGVLWSCAPCFNHRGLDESETLEGTTVTGAGPMLEWIAGGASTLSF